MIAALLICPVLWILLKTLLYVIPQLRNIYYAVDISNRFSSLPIKQASMVAESDVEEISVPLVDVHTIYPSLGGIKLPPSFQPLAQERLGN